MLQWGIRAKLMIFFCVVFLGWEVDSVFQTMWGWLPIQSMIGDYPLLIHKTASLLKYQAPSMVHCTNGISVQLLTIGIAPSECCLPSTSL